jgi:hypothetical protein
VSCTLLISAQSRCGRWLRGAKTMRNPKGICGATVSVSLCVVFVVLIFRIRTNTSLS